MSAIRSPLTVRQKITLAFVGFGIGLALTLGVLGINELLHRHSPGYTAEDTARLKTLFDRNTGSVFMFDPDLSYRLKPNFRGNRHGWWKIRNAPPSSPELGQAGRYPHQTNSLGLLGPDEADPSPTVRKIVFLGDSVLYGEGVTFEETFVSRMKAAAGPATQLFNSGCSGWSTEQELTFFNKYLRRRADWSLVVVVFCLNDLVTHEVCIGQDNGLYSNYAGLGSDPCVQMLEKDLSFPEKLAQAKRLLAIRDSFDASSATSVLNNHHNGFLLAWDSVRWSRYESAVLDPLLYRGNLPPTVVVAIPTPYQAAAAMNHAPDAVTFFPQRRLADYCRKRRIPFIDAAPALLVPDPDSGFLDDTHLTPLGHQRVAEYLWPRIMAIRSDPASRRVKKP